MTASGGCLKIGAGLMMSFLFLVLCIDNLVIFAEFTRQGSAGEETQIRYNDSTK